MARDALASAAPRGDDVEVARRALVLIRRNLAEQDDSHDPVMLAVEGEREQVAVPRAALELLVRILANMAAGQGVTVVPSHAELTTQQAASILNVSRPFLIGLLEDGQIEYRTVGTHRRIQAASLLEYMRHDSVKRRAVADELTALTQEMGLT